MQLSSWTALSMGFKLGPSNHVPFVFPTSQIDRAPICCSGCCVSFRNKQSRSHLTEILHVKCLDNLPDVLGTVRFLAEFRRGRTGGKMNILDCLPQSHVGSLSNEHCILWVGREHDANSLLYWRILEVRSDTRLGRLLRPSFTMHTGPSCRVNTCTTLSWLAQASS